MPVASSSTRAFEKTTADATDAASSASVDDGALELSSQQPHDPVVKKTINDGPMTVALCVPCIPRDIPFLEASLLPSVLNQTEPPAEVIIALSETNSSAGSSLESRWNHSIPFHVLATTAPQSPGQNRNRCAHATNTRIVSFMDADDEMHPQRLSIIRQVLSETNATCALHSFTTTALSSDVTFTWRDKIHSLVYFDSSWECLRGKEMMRRAGEFVRAAWNGQRSYPFEQHGHVSCYTWVVHKVQFDDGMEGEDTHFNSNVWHKFNQSVYVPLPLSRWTPSDSQPIMKATVSVWSTLEAMLQKAGVADVSAV